jgi:hypothetical protein
MNTMLQPPPSFTIQISTLQTVRNKTNENKTPETSNSEENWKAVNTKKKKNETVPTTQETLSKKQLMTTGLIALQLQTVFKIFRKKKMRQRIILIPKKSNLLLSPSTVQTISNH